ncbi:hypothetical protein ACHAW5_003237 [Stephanodiscus triporus]|uniref:Peptidase S1 domain-containing protein n=1 Tax=Stephanodiscus triporus TaxID=2934178 RepID=A0ABD3NZE8_9STRA
MNIILVMRGALTALWSAACLVATPALAITFGELDGNANPNVGALLVKDPYPDGPLYLICSGTLISPTVFLTAAHCVSWMPGEGIPADQVFVTFDSVFTNVSKTFQGTYHVNPKYRSNIVYKDDVAVVVFNKSIRRITPATLPPAGFLDALNVQGLLKDEQFVTVGYGDVLEDKTKGLQTSYFDGVRRNTNGTFSALTDDWLKISINPSLDDGGTCYGDSGGPHMLNGMVVSITATGDVPCRATDATFRIDTDWVLAFLEQFVTPP